MKLELMQDRRQSFELSDDEYYLSVSHLLEIARDLPELFEKAEIEQKRILLKTIVSNFSLDGDLLRWKYKKPFDTMALCSQNSNWFTMIEEVMPIIRSGNQNEASQREPDLAQLF